MQYDIIPKDQHASEIEAYFEGRIESESQPPPVNCFTVVCFTNRSGSTFICSALSRLGIAGKPNRVLNYEYFNSNIVKEESAELGLKSFDDYVHHCIRLYGTSNGNFTTKLSITQFNWLLESGVIARLGVSPRVILVRRRNVIAQAVSFATAKQDGRWTSLHPQKGNTSPQLDVSFVLAAAKAICEQNALFDLLLDFHDLKSITVWYEEIAANESRLLSDLARYYGLDSQVLGTSTLPVEQQSAEHKLQWETEVRAFGRAKQHSKEHTAYSSQPCTADPEAEKLRAELHQRTIEAEKLRAELGQRTTEAEQMKTALNAIYHSRSWRLTRPLRAIRSNLLRR
jgi:LPS sulfotransferase NodH